MSDQTVISSYRTYLRQVRSLPHVYLRCFFKIKGADDFRSLLKTESVKLRNIKLKRVSKDLRRLRAANRGETPAFDRILDIAYGRTGKLRWELMEPLLSEANAPLLASTNLPKANPPVYSQELVALLTSGLSHTTRPLQKRQLVSPPDLLGRFPGMAPSKRREHNHRWRFFNTEWKKVYPPLQVCPTRIHSRTLGFQDVPILQQLFALAGSPSMLPPSERERQQDRKTSQANQFDGSLSVRWLRRRYQALLGRIPILIPKPSLLHLKRTYEVELADGALVTSRTHPSRLRSVGIEDITWMTDIKTIAK